MTLTRAVFVAVLLTPIIGLIGSHYVVSAMLGGDAAPAFAPRATLAPTREAHRHTAVPTTSSTQLPALQAAMRSTSTPTPKPRVTRTPRPAATATVMPTPTAGIITLARYWIGTTVARHGSTISFGYVIDNATGQSAELMLGASIKSSRTLSWVGTAISDPAHDVVATVPPGVTTHTRYFTIPSRLKPGSYDVAWGLRNSTTGQSVAVVSSIASLSVRR